MDAKTFGAFIQTRRKELELTQAELAGLLHVTDKAVSRWERGVGFPEVTLMEPLADALEVSLLELMQSRKLEADTLSAGEAEAAVAGALELAQDKKRKICLWLWGFGAYLGIVGVMMFFLYTLMWFVDVLWIRSVSTYLTFTCASMAMDGVSQSLRRKADPEDPLLKRGWQYYAARLLASGGALLLLLSISFVSGLDGQTRDIFRMWGFVMTAAGCFWLLASNKW